MDISQVRRAAQTLEDVFTPDGDAVVIDGRVTRRRGTQGVRVTGNTGDNFRRWYPLTDLTAREDL